jgi:hypothetical protein
MCDYRLESRKALTSLNVPLHQVHRAVGRRALAPLRYALRDGRAKAGRDLRNGQRLAASSLAQGHYMSPQSFQRTLNEMGRRPSRCAWCKGQLPPQQVQLHLRPHNHREEIRHHFHADCWTARLLAIAVIFGHVQPEAFGTRRGHPQLRRLRIEEVVTTIKKVWIVR